MSSVSRINQGCIYYPCHKKDELEDCTLCYCPMYPCQHPKYGKFLENGIWDCSDCSWPHKKERIDELYELIKHDFSIFKFKNGFWG